MNNPIANRSIEKVFVTTGTQGPAGRPGQDGSIGIIFDFAYGDATPSLIVQAYSHKKIYNAIVHIDEEFDGTGAAISIGTLNDPELIYPANLNNPAEKGQYLVFPSIEFNTETELYLFITPGMSASQGRGQVTLLNEP